jgi:hypothetical protein
MKKPTGIAVITLTFGKSITYPDRTPEMAPDAPMAGIVESQADAMKRRDAEIPHIR